MAATQSTVTPKSIILITGANSGIGYAVADAILREKPQDHLILACRNAKKGQEALKKLADAHDIALDSDAPSEASHIEPRPRLSLVVLDVDNYESIKAAAAEVKQTFGRLDILISNAGITAWQISDALTKFEQTFRTNNIGPALLVESFQDLLAAPSPNNNVRRVVHVTSSLGSIQARLDPSRHNYAALGGDHYRMSKAATNMLAACNYARFDVLRKQHLADPEKSKSLVPPKTMVHTYDPGVVLTNLSGASDRPEEYERLSKLARSPEVAAEGLMTILRGNRDYEDPQTRDKGEGAQRGMFVFDKGTWAW